MKKIEAWQTLDDKVFSSESEAKTHEERLMRLMEVKLKYPPLTEVDNEKLDRSTDHWTEVGLCSGCGSGKFYRTITDECECCGQDDLIFLDVENRLDGLE